MDGQCVDGKWVSLYICWIGGKSYGWWTDEQIPGWWVNG